MPKSPDDKKVSVYLPRPLHRKIKVLCAQQGIPIQRFFEIQVVRLLEGSSLAGESSLPAPLKAQFSVDETGMTLRTFSPDAEAWRQFIVAQGVSREGINTELALSQTIPRRRRKTAEPQPEGQRP
jgi:hypothetical protein